MARRMESAELPDVVDGSGYSEQGKKRKEQLPTPQVSHTISNVEPCQLEPPPPPIFEESMQFSS